MSAWLNTCSCGEIINHGARMCQACAERKEQEKQDKKPMEDEDEK
jgi:hypothetical protein